MISTRSMLAVGMLLKSAAVLTELPPGTRRPLTSTRLRTELRLRRLARFRPEVPTPLKVDCVRDSPKAGANCASWVAMSAKFSMPRSAIDCGVTASTGVELNGLVRAMREPVMTTLAVLSALACWAMDWDAAAAVSSRATAL